MQRTSPAPATRGRPTTSRDLAGLLVRFDHLADVRHLDRKCGSSPTSTAVRTPQHRGHFPNEQAALKCVYLAVMALDPTGAGRRWTIRWKPALNAFEGRLTASRN